MEQTSQDGSSSILEIKEKKVEISEKTEDTPKILPPTVYMCSGASERPFVCQLDTLCPEQSTDDIANDYAINNWVFNHLPLRDEDQKADLAKKLLLDQSIKEKKEKHEKKKKDMQKSKTMPKLVRQASKSLLPDFSSRGSVKETSKHFTKSHEQEGAKK